MINKKLITGQLNEAYDALATVRTALKGQRKLVYKWARLDIDDILKQLYEIKNKVK